MQKTCSLLAEKLEVEQKHALERQTIAQNQLSKDQIRADKKKKKRKNKKDTKDEDDTFLDNLIENQNNNFTEQEKKLTDWLTKQKS